MPSSSEWKKNERKDDKERCRKRRSRSSGRDSDRRGHRSSSQDKGRHDHGRRVSEAAWLKRQASQLILTAESPAGRAAPTTGAGESGKCLAGQIFEDYYEDLVAKCKESDAEIPDPGPVNQVGLTTARGSEP